MSVHWALTPVLRLAWTHKDPTLVAAGQGSLWMLMDEPAMMTMSVHWTLTDVTRTVTTLSEVTGAAAMLGTPSTVMDAHAMRTTNAVPALPTTVNRSVSTPQDPMLANATGGSHSTLTEGLAMISMNASGITQETAISVNTNAPTLTALTFAHAILAMHSLATTSAA